MNKINVEKVIDYTKVLKDNEILQDMDKILRNENTNLKLEIERLKKQNKALNEMYELTKKEYIRLNNIIKEVREYIEEKYNYILKDDTFLDHDERIDRKQIKHILEILGSDKE